MIKRIPLSILILLFTVPALAAPPPPTQIFDRFWEASKSKIYPLERGETFFTPQNYQRLKQQVKKIPSLYELTPIINDFLKGLKISHTQFYDDHSIDFYLFRSMFLTRNINSPRVNHMGAQFALIDNHFVVREVLEGYPADRAGIRRGDVLLESNGRAYHAFNPKGKEIGLTLRRGKKDSL